MSHYKGRHRATKQRPANTPVAAPVRLALPTTSVITAAPARQAIVIRLTRTEINAAAAVYAQRFAAFARAHEWIRVAT